MADNYYIPGMPQDLEAFHYTPRLGPGEVKRLREQNPGNRGLQQELAVADRYHLGKGMASDNPVAALAALVGQVPYDVAKLAYFNGPAPVKQALGKISERLFPGEGFNDKTTARPDIRQYQAMQNGIMEGTYGKVRRGIRQVNEASDSLPEPVLNGLAKITNGMNHQPDLPMGVPAIGNYALKGVRGANNLVQTMIPWTDTREDPRAYRPDPVSPTEQRRLDELLRGLRVDAPTKTR